MFGQVSYGLARRLAKIPPPSIRRVPRERVEGVVVQNISDALLCSPAISGDLVISINAVKPESAPLDLLTECKIYGQKETTIKSPEISDDFLRWLGALLVPSIWASDNLFVPLGRSAAHGKNYAEQHPDVKQKEMFDWSTEKTQPPEGGRKAYTIRKTGPQSWEGRAASLWDLIYPILLPPLRVDFGQILDLPSPLYEFQIGGVEFLRSHPEALLADEMGTGKTVMATVALRILFQQGKVSTALIVCPASVLDVWDRHLLEWAPPLVTTVVRGNKQVRENDWRFPAHVYLTTYDTLRNDVMGETLLGGDRLESFDVVIADEAQQAKNPESGRSRAIKAIMPKFRWALSGTPLENRLDDLISIFEFVKPGLLQAEGLTPREAQQLIKPYFLRRSLSTTLRH